MGMIYSTHAYSKWRKQEGELKNGVSCDVTPCGSCETGVSVELSASIIRVTRIGELGTLALTSNRRTLRRTLYFFASCVVS
jgi:hypothetical protein